MRKTWTGIQIRCWTKTLNSYFRIGTGRRRQKIRIEIRSVVIWTVSGSSSEFGTSKLPVNCCRRKARWKRSSLSVQHNCLELFLAVSVSARCWPVIWTCSSRKLQNVSTWSGAFVTLIEVSVSKRKEERIQNYEQPSCAVWYSSKVTRAFGKTPRKLKMWDSFTPKSYREVWCFCEGRCCRRRIRK